MFVVRKIFSKPDLLAETVCQLALAGQIPAALGAELEPLGFLVRSGGAKSLIDAAYLPLVRTHDSRAVGKIVDKGCRKRLQHCWP